MLTNPETQIIDSALRSSREKRRTSSVTPLCSYLLMNINKDKNFRPSLHQYVFIENDIVFVFQRKRNDCIAFTHCFRIVFISFPAVYTKTMKTMKKIENDKNIRNLLFPPQDNLWLLLHRFEKFAFSVKTIRLHDTDVIITLSFPNLSTLKIVFKSYQF